MLDRSVCEDVRLHSDIGKVLSDSGIYRSMGELREFVGEYMGVIGL